MVEDGSIIRCRPLAREAAARAIRRGPRARAASRSSTAAAAARAACSSRRARAPAGLVGYYLERARDEVRPVEDVLAALAREEPIQVMFGGALAEMEELLGGARGGARGRGARSSAPSTPRPASRSSTCSIPRVGKADALAFLQRRWGIAAAETLAIGDNWNDREMLEAAGRGLLMGNADRASCSQLGLSRAADERRGRRRPRDRNARPALEDGAAVLARCDAALGNATGCERSRDSLAA